MRKAEAQGLASPRKLWGYRRTRTTQARQR